MGLRDALKGFWTEPAVSRRTFLISAGVTGVAGAASGPLIQFIDAFTPPSPDEQAKATAKYISKLSDHQLSAADKGDIMHILNTGAAQADKTKQSAKPYNYNDALEAAISHTMDLIRAHKTDAAVGAKLIIQIHDGSGRQIPQENMVDIGVLAQQIYDGNIRAAQARQRIGELFSTPQSEAMGSSKQQVIAEGGTGSPSQVDLRTLVDKALSSPGGSPADGAPGRARPKTLGGGTQIS